MQKFTKRIPVFDKQKNSGQNLILENKYYLEIDDLVTNDEIKQFDRCTD